MRQRVNASMVVVRLTHVHQCQHHENKSLQRHNQNVEDCPARTSQNMTNEQKYACGRAEANRTHQGNQHEQQFTRIHVAEESQAVRDSFGSKLNHLHQKVDGIQKPFVTKRGRKQLMHPAAKTFDLDVVVQADQQHAARHAESGRQISRWHDAKVFNFLV